MINPNIAITAVKPQNRIASLDILRGFALLGIAMVNILGFNASFFDFGGFYSQLPDPSQVHFYEVIIGLCADKFIFLFSFLFGYGIWMQYHRFTVRQGHFYAFFIRRMGVLLLFGMAHVLFLWAGDILIPYAIAGMVVLALSKFSNTILLTLAAFFYFFVIFWLTISVWIPLPNALSSTCPECMGQAMDVYAHGNYLSILNLRLTEYSAFIPVNLIYYFPKIMGITLFGFVASRLQLHLKLEQHRRVWLWITCVILAVGCLAYLYYENLVMTIISPESEFLTAAYMFGYEIMNLFLASGYILAILLMCSFKPSRLILKPLSYPGRMSLTNYLMQSVLFGFLFYGWGLGFFGWQKPAQIEIYAILIFLSEVLTSYFWLQKFEQGPLEHLWKKLSYRHLSRR